MSKERLEILNGRKSIKLYIDQLESVLFLDGDDVKSYLAALISFSRTETIPSETTASAAALFHAIKSGLEKANNAYIRQAKVNRENGGKGGRPKDDPPEEGGSANDDNCSLDNKEASIDEQNEVSDANQMGSEEKTENNRMGLNGFFNTDTVTVTVTDTDTDTGSGCCYYNADNLLPEQQHQQQQPDTAISLPLADGSVYDIGQTDFKHLEGLYPRVDVRASLQKYQAWLMQYPDSIPGARMMPLRVKEWLSKEKRALKTKDPPISDAERDRIDKTLQDALGDPWEGDDD